MQTLKVVGRAAVLTDEQKSKFIGCLDEALEVVNNFSENDLNTEMNFRGIPSRPGFSYSGARSEH